MRSSQIKDLKNILAELDSEIKLVCVCGNHDVGDQPTRESIDMYKSEFGDDYFSFWQNGCKFIALNSQIYFDSSKIPELKEQQEFDLFMYSIK
jgi:predicted MPP superfamily phosphohydrolase